MDVRYTPGPRFVVVGEYAIAVLDPAVSAEVLETVWRTLVAGGGVGEVLQAMTGGYGTSLTAIPPFAVIAPAVRWGSPSWAAAHQIQGPPLQHEPRRNRLTPWER